MNQLVEHIVNKEHTKANELLEQHLSNIVESKLNEVKKMIAARMDEQVSVQNDGMVHTAAGEELLPSVYRQRRQLAEGKWSKKVQPGDEPKIVKKKKEMAHPPLPPGKQAAKEKAERLRIKRIESAKRTAERKKAAEEEAKRKAEEALITREGNPNSNKPAPTPTVAGEYLMPTSGPIMPYTPQKTQKATPKPRPRPVGYNNWSTLKKLAFNAREKIESKLGLKKEEALKRAKAIVETRALDKAIKDVQALAATKKYESPMPKAQPTKIDPKVIEKYLHDYAANARKKAQELKKKPK